MVCHCYRRLRYERDRRSGSEVRSPDECEATEQICPKVGLFNLLEAASYTLVAHHI